MNVLIRPIVEPRRSGMSRPQWAFELAVWACILAGGLVVMAGGSPAVTAVIGPNPILVAAFAAFWLGGGAAGLAFRFFDLGIIETPAIYATLGALLEYEAILAFAVRHGLSIGMPSILAGVAIFTLLARLAALFNLYGRARQIGLLARIRQQLHPTR